jgi:hypothetical protein
MLLNFVGNVFFSVVQLLVALKQHEKISFFIGPPTTDILLGSPYHPFPFDTEHPWMQPWDGKFFPGIAALRENHPLCKEASKKLDDSWNIRPTEWIHDPNDLHFKFLFAWTSDLEHSLRESCSCVQGQLSLFGAGEQEICKSGNFLRQFIVIQVIICWSVDN